MSNDQVKILIRKRATLKAKLTSFGKFIDLFTGDPEQSPPDKLVIEIQAREPRFQGLLHEFEEIQDEIDTLVADGEFDQQATERDAFETKFYSLSSRANEILSGYSKDLQSQLPSPPLSRAASQNSVHSHDSNLYQIPQVDSVKLPFLKLEQFDGKPEHFPAFFDAFKSLIHNRQNLDDVSKFLYLRTALSEEPLKVIESLEVIAENYGTAIELLEKRYHNKQLMIHNHVKGIVDFPPIQKDSYKSLRQLLDELQTHHRSLKNLKIPVGEWDCILIYIIVEKFPYHTKKEWETEIAENQDNLPTYNDLIKFLEKRCRLLEKIYKQSKEFNSPQVVKPRIDNKFYKPKQATQSHVATKSFTCPSCKEEHPLYMCKSFLDMSVNDRLELVKGLDVCSNCLRTGHSNDDCKSGHCRKCSQRHSTLLHKHSSSASSQSQTTSASATSCNLVKHRFVEQILPTAKILVFSNGKSLECTALLDSGSMRSYMTVSLAKKLQLNIRPTDFSIIGINKTKAKACYECSANIASLHGNFSAKLSFLLLPKITETLPAQLKVDSLLIPSNIPLADPNFSQSSEIDILLGVDIFWKLIKSEQRYVCDFPYIINSELGYIVSGQFDCETTQTNPVIHCNLSFATLSKQIAQFWEQETCEEKSAIYSSEEELCESNFANTTKRHPDGRFIVTFPLKESPETLGNSKDRAVKQFLALERKLIANPELKKAYSEFISEYETLEHMEKVDSTSDQPPFEYYMPHLPVIREHSLTTKLRVVFNSSAQTTNGISLNDIQMNGPVIQDDLFSIVLRFRRFKYVLSGDCSKMYRCVLLDPSQRSLQRILWRNDTSEPIQTYELCTVTYGQKASSFLAIRCLFELARLCEKEHPEIANIIKKDMYCDDLLTSVDSLEKADYICKSISQVLKTGGFVLRKWISNEPKILSSIDTSDISNKILKFGPDECAQTLGLSYSPVADQLQFQITVDDSNCTPTKRKVLSIISKIFDPLGLLSICTITAKVFMQQLWLTKIQWDDPLTPELKAQWETFSKELKQLNEIKISRHVMMQNPKLIEIHGFSDASMKAFGACVYVRSTNTHGEVSVHLLCSKTKVAPLKQLTIPRLELSAATILVKLIDKVKKSLNLPINSVTYWTDSKIVLAWINTEPYRLQTFVSNRVVQVQTLSCPSSWRYVPTKENPGDLLSRGVSPLKIANLNLWWYGPGFLQEDESHWPLQNSSIPCTELTEMKSDTQCHALQTADPPFMFENCSTLAKIEKVAAFCIRFIANCRSARESRQTGLLTLSERQAGLHLAIKQSQIDTFKTELKILSSGNKLDPKNKMSNLNPFYDSDLKIIRVGGQLSHSDFGYDKKHPIVLSSKHLFTKVMFRSEHLRLMHAGSQLLLSSIRESYWPIGGRSLARQTVRTCIPCFKVKPLHINNIMGDLPRDRVSPQSPFSIVGSDFAGPFLIKDKKGRGAKIAKCYICVFICFATKAAHLELVSDLTTDAFLMALRRFSARRGMPSKIYSDNGKNYVGANNQLRELGLFLAENSDLEKALANERFNWIFLPPYSPHMGGIWEACVKSVKHHLKRVMNNQSFTFEQLNTIIYQIEAVLNSRPLSPMSSDPSDLNPLTPSHFLVGKSLTMVPDPDVTHLQPNRLDLHQQLQQIVQNVWARWSKEYIAELQLRNKWKKLSPEKLEGALVLLVDNNLPPIKWRLGRVTQLHPGKDGVTRVVTLKTATGQTQRAITKICPLPSEDDE